MANEMKTDKFISGAIHHPGRLTAAAKRAGMSISAYANAHKHDPQGTIGDAARMYLNVLKPAVNGIKADKK
jgi:hypothetical protein